MIVRPGTSSDLLKVFNEYQEMQKYCWKKLVPKFKQNLFIRDFEAQCFLKVGSNLYQDPLPKTGGTTK